MWYSKRKECNSKLRPCFHTCSLPRTNFIFTLNSHLNFLYLFPQMPDVPALCPSQTLVKYFEKQKVQFTQQPSWFCSQWPLEESPWVRRQEGWLCALCAGPWESCFSVSSAGRGAWYKSAPTEGLLSRQPSPCHSFKLKFRKLLVFFPIYCLRNIPLS